MNRRAALLPLVLFLTGCAAVKGFFTKPTGMICVPHDVFVQTWAIVETLGTLYFEDEIKRCGQTKADAARCLTVVDARGLARQLQVGINAKIAHPEITIDTANIAALLKALIALKP